MLNYNITPMLLSESNKVPISNNYIYELKYDGIRALIYINSKNIKIYTRNKIDVTYLFPELKKLKNLTNSNTILDGEIICTKDGKPNFSKLLSRIRLKNKEKINSQSIWNRVTFICFDILMYNNLDLKDYTLLERKNILNNFKDNDIFFKSKIFYDGKKLFKTIKKFNLEGIVCKDINSKYIPNTRTNNWIKVKNYKTENFYIGGYKINTSHTISIYLGELSNNRLNYIGKVFVSKKNKLYKKLQNSKKTANNFTNLEENIIFIKPDIKVKIRYIERTENNRLREAFLCDS